MFHRTNHPSPPFLPPSQPTPQIPPIPHLANQIQTKSLIFLFRTIKILQTITKQPNQTKAKGKQDKAMQCKAVQNKNRNEINQA